MTKNTKIDTVFNVTYNVTTGTDTADSDIYVVIDNKKIGILEQVSYIVTREMAPIYTICSTDPRAYAEGKRSIAGSINGLYIHKLETLRVLLANRKSHLMPPLDIVTTACHRETNEIAYMKILGCEIMKQDYGMTVDEFTNNKHHEHLTYIAHGIQPWKHEAKCKAIENDDGMIINPFTGRKSWL